MCVIEASSVPVELQFLLCLEVKSVLLIKFLAHIKQLMSFCMPGCDLVGGEGIVRARHMGCVAG